MERAECLFCKIADKEVPSKLVHENDEAIVIEDMNPHAPAHLLVIPKRHIANLFDLTPGDHSLMGRIMGLLPDLARQFRLEDNGFRVVINSGVGAGQTIFHLHFHLMGGRPFHWPPG